ncbi:DUF3310 domain-containing protein [Mammaliicoccus lentus]|uniref:DUF3310 domain-containing protein n=1 Tax=Mammaliicoccus lentus TaxID=42858 RepID=UPI001C4E0E6C|nr:DUF3310 domain-containing protein [Mammaliicoccus lentus]MBW0770484.1 DUF3310 domain-containing protein [Mammaliicoccus lentus]
MKFKEGDRVHVKRLAKKDVDFYGTISEVIPSANYYFLMNCTYEKGESVRIFKPNSMFFGKNRQDYYVLAEDEEDTEEPVIQRINDMYNDVPTHYKADIDVIEFCRQHFTDEEFKGAMKFNLIKYPTRLGRKDDMVKELDKIIDYAQRYKEVLESGITR